MIGRFNPAGLLAGRPDVQKQAMMAQQQPETRQGLLGRTRGVIGGLLGGIQGAAERGSPDMNWGERAMILGGGLQQLGGQQGALMDSAGFVDQRVQGRQQEQAMQQQQEQMAQFRASLPPEQQQLFDMDPEGFLTQMTQAEFREAPQDPTAVREYQLAQQQGFEGSFMDFDAQRRAASRPQTNVNVQPAVPDREDVLSIDGDFVTVRDPESPAGVRRIPIPGSATDLRQRMSEDERVEQDAARFRNFMRTSGTAIQDINRSLEQVSDNPRLVGAIGSGLANVPETEQRVIRERMRSVAGNIGVEEIMGFREQGGTLGAIPMAQQVAFQQLRGAIDNDLPFDEWMQNAMRLNNLYMDMMFPDGAPEDAPYYELPFDQYGRAREFTQDSPARPRTNIEMAILPAGAFYVDPDDGQLYRKRGR